MGFWSKVSGVLMVALLGVLAALGFEKAGREKDRRKTAEASRETQEKATDAMVEGLEQEGKVREEDNSDRHHFE